MSHTKEDTCKHLTLQCRFFNGEEEAPEWMGQNEKMFWLYEKCWALGDIQDAAKGLLVKHPSMRFFEMHDGTPDTLKALLCDRFCYAGGTEELFMIAYKRDYQIRPTNLQRRKIKRMSELQEKCLYFKGEEQNPWTFCYSPVLVWRKKMWDWEARWCNALSHSFRAPQNSTQLIKDLLLEDFFQKKGCVSMSLLNYILGKIKEECDEKEEAFGPAQAILAYEKYMKQAPLGRDHRMYFAFYLGEEKSPYEMGGEEYQQMGWSQERMQNDHLHDDDDFMGEDFQRRYRGKEGIWGWYADPKFPLQQKQILFFAIANWGIWCPFCDEDKLAEEYLNYHYPGDKD